MNELSPRQKISIAILLLYVIPILILSAYSIIEGSSFSWSLFSIGLVLSSIGSLSFFFLFKQMEEEATLKTAEAVAAASFYAPSSMETVSSAIEENPANEVNQEQINILQSRISELERTISQNHHSLESKTDEIQRLHKEKKETQRNLDLAIEDLSSYKKSHEKLFQQQEILLEEYQRTIEDQRTTLDKKEQQVHQMENRIRDLNYEIKTLLHIAELHTQSSHDSWAEGSLNDEIKLTDADREDIFSELAEGHTIKSPGEAALLLKRCIDNAQKIASAYHFTKGSARFRDLPVDHYALELRRLFDSLRDEVHGTVIVFSPTENKLLFVNQQVKILLGWSQDKFAQDFIELIADGHYQWKNAIAQMPPKSESQFQLSIKAKGHQDRKINCHLGIIPFGIFKDLIIGVLF